MTNFQKTFHLPKIQMKQNSLDSINLLQFEDWRSFEVPSQVPLLTKENKQIFSSPSFVGAYGKSELSKKRLRCISIMYTRGLNHVSDGSLNEKVCLSFWEAGHKNILQIGEIRAEVPRRTAGLISNLRIFLFDCLSRQTGKSSKGVVGVLASPSPKILQNKWTSNRSSWDTYLRPNNTPNPLTQLCFGIRRLTCYENSSDCKIKQPTKWS